MTAITLATAQAKLAEWLDADSQLASGQSYSIGDRAVTRAEALKEIKYWSNMVNRLTATSGRSMIRVRRGVL
jgi:hypothetical protein